MRQTLDDPLLVAVLLAACILAGLKLYIRILRNRRIERSEACLARNRAEIQSGMDFRQ